MKKILLLGAMWCAPLLLFAQEGEKGVRFMDNEPWKTVLKQAQQQDRWIFVDCYTSWCGPCKQLAREVFPQEQVGQFINDRFVSVKYDVEKEAGLEFARNYRDYIQAFPTLLLIKPDGMVMHRIVGAFPAEVMLQSLQSALDGITWQILEKEFLAGNRELEFVKNYIGLLGTSGEDAKVQEVANEYLNYIPLDSLLNKEIWDLVEVYICQPESKAFQFVLHHLNDFANRGFDRYQLEWKLALNTYYQISRILETGFKTTNRDTLESLKNELVFLDTLLRNPVKGFPEYLAYVRTEAAYLNGNPEELFYRLIYLGENHLFNNLDWEKAWGNYLLDNLSDKKKIKRYVEYLLQVQQHEEATNDWIVKNCYDVLAKGYNCLKDKKRAEECVRAGEKLDKQNKEKLKAFNF